MLSLVHSSSNGFAQASMCKVALAGVSLLLLASCSGSDDFTTVTSEDADRAEAHVDEHVHHAPHGGHLIELGDHKYNAEVVLESEPKQLVVYLLDAHAENPVAIESEPLTLEVAEGEPIVLEPQPQETDGEGTSSRFVAGGASVESISDVEALTGSLKVTIKDTEYTGALSHDHDAHDHDGHDH
jgi:hypothetical protein